MNVRHQLQGIEFEWNARKSEANLNKHGIEFEIACEVFFDPLLRAEDGGVSDGERRDAVIGLTVNWQLLYVVYVMRDDDTIRIISARPATKAERKSYESQ